MIVFGKIAGENAAKYSKEQDGFSEIDQSDIDEVIEETLEPLSREGGENPAKVVNDLREMMQNKAGIIRTGELLEEALNDLEDLRSRSALTSPGGGRTYNPGWHQALEIGAMVDVSKMCAIAALRREESRGAHTRDDFPETDDNHWGKINSVILMGDDGSMNIDFVSYPKIPKELRSLLDSDDLQEEE